MSGHSEYIKGSSGRGEARTGIFTRNCFSCKWYLARTGRGCMASMEERIARGCELPSDPVKILEKFQEAESFELTREVGE